MRLIAMLLLAAFSAAAQSFEVASIKPSGPNSQRGSEGGPGRKDPAHYRFNSATLLDLIAIAHNVHYFQIQSKTPLDRDRFDLAANVPEGATKDDFRAMMRNLLAERFHLKSRAATKEFSGFELVVAKGGPRLAPPSPRDLARFPDLPPGRPGMVSMNSISGGMILVRTRAQQQSMDALAEWLQLDDQPVVNRTGLDGLYDFLLEYTKEPSHGASGAPQTPEASSLFTAVRQQLGLQLVARKIPLPLIVVDSFDKAPTDN